MCGRAAQTYRAAAAAARALGVPDDGIPRAPPSEGAPAGAAGGKGGGGGSAAAADGAAVPWTDNYNMSPGMDAYVVYREGAASSAAGEGGSCLRVGIMKWGLVPNSVAVGAAAAGAAPTMADHFASRMFNARTDTLLEKRTFNKLVGAGQTCVVALDGFFEWRSEAGSAKKQPYFVGRRPYLLLAGLWSRSAATAQGRPFDAFTILTTDVTPSLSWLHTRVPVMLDERAARAWLDGPWERRSRGSAGPSWTYREQSGLLDRLERACRSLERVQWHAVTPQMTSLKFRSPESIRALPRAKTLASFFSPKKQAGASAAPSLPSSAAAAAAVKSSAGDDRDGERPGDDAAASPPPHRLKSPPSPPSKRPLRGTAAEPEPRPAAAAEAEAASSGPASGASSGGPAPTPPSSAAAAPPSPSPASKRARRAKGHGTKATARIDSFFVRRSSGKPS